MANGQMIELEKVLISGLILRHLESIFVLNMNPTRTTNRLHFTDLDPMRFEDLCLNLVSRYYKWDKITPLGRMGTDGGADIIGVRVADKRKLIYYIQCKRYIRIEKRDLKILVDKVAENHNLPDILWVIVACDISRTNYEYLIQYALEKNIKEVEVWTGQVIEAKLYSDYPDLLLTYFGVSVGARRESNIKKIKSRLKMEKRVEKELISMDFIKNPANREILAQDPSSKFISDSVFIRSVDDQSYPEVPRLKKGEFNPYFKTYFYDLYEGGIEFWLGAGLGTYVIMDKNGFWEPIQDSQDIRLKDAQYKVYPAKQIGRIAYHDIVELKPDGDNRYTCPHVFCRFDYEGMPYEEIYFRYDGNSRGTFDSDFDKTKQTVFDNPK